MQFDFCSFPHVYFSPSPAVLWVMLIISDKRSHKTPLLSGQAKCRICNNFFWVFYCNVFEEKNLICCDFYRTSIKWILLSPLYELNTLTSLETWWTKQNVWMWGWICWLDLVAFVTFQTAWMALALSVFSKWVILCRFQPSLFNIIKCRVSILYPLWYWTIDKSSNLYTYNCLQA